MAVQVIRLAPDRAAEIMTRRIGQMNRLVEDLIDSTWWARGTLTINRRRLDLGEVNAVLISGPAIFAIEFKCGQRQFRLHDYNQAWDYDLDLKNFHAASHNAPIFPILVATQAETADGTWQPPYPNGVRPPYRCGAPPSTWPRRRSRAE